MTDDDVLAKCLPINGWMLRGELLWLYRHAELRRVIVELGVWQGRSTAALALGTPGKVYTIDHWLGSPDERETYHAAVATVPGRSRVMARARRNLAPFVAAGRCELIEGDADLEADRFRRLPIDMLFIDAGHDEESVRRNLDSYVPLMALGGLVCGHDFKPDSHPGLCNAVRERFGQKVQRGPGSIWYIA